uniref:NADH:ubiquinone reductase (H(+)-translocating) n=1 Tax=Polyplacotoma mediterranea TaxID=2283839 RepID=A0A481YJB1_9METZ|nr:NADH dehydrogenase subunit 2 [Polyplacotoma mediterranea]QBK82181.1 NADH dehydrogenase subunit 2 [Polyplacotoma mediterranea]
MNNTLYMEGLALQIPYEFIPIVTYGNVSFVQLLLTFSIFIILLRKPSYINLYIALFTIFFCLCYNFPIFTNIQSINYSKEIMEILSINTNTLTQEEVRPGATTESIILLCLMGLCSLGPPGPGLALFLIVGLGGLLIINSVDYLSIYLALEFQTFALFILTAYGAPFHEEVKKTIGPGLVHCAEGGLKYWILGAMSSGFYLFGCALYFGITGSENMLGTIYPGIMDTNMDLWAGSLGYLFILVSFLFKLGVAPFHMWTPDVYEGAPTSTTALIAIIPKFSIFILIIGLAFSTTKLLFLVALVSLLIGALGALNQTRIKRLLAYSGIGHMGFILLGLSIGSYDSFHNSFIYILIYLLTILASFTLLCSLEELKRTPLGLIIDFSLFSRGYPYLSFSIAILFLSLAGIPPLLGFLGKWLILVGSIKTALTFSLPIYYWGSFIAGICATLSAFYYIRIVATLYFNISRPLDNNFINYSPSVPLSFLFLWESLLLPLPPFPLSRSILIGLYLYFILFLIFTPQSLFLLSHEAILGIV